MKSRIPRPVARRLGAGVLALLASMPYAPPAGAEEGGGWFDAIVDLLKRPEGTAVDVPLRKTDRAPEREPEVSPLPAEPEAPAETVKAPSEAPEVVETGAPVPSKDTDAPSEPPAAQALPPSNEDTDTLNEAPSAQAPPPPPVEMPARVEGANLSHVHRAVRDLTAEIRILREELGARDAPHEVEPVEGRAPVHLHVKTLEVWTKVAQAQRRLGVPAGEVGRVPPRTVDAADILVNVEHLRNELARIKARMGIARAIDPAPLEAAVTPPSVYRDLAEASLLLDALRGGPIGPDDLHRHATAVLDEAALIASALGASAGADPPPVRGAKQPIDIAQQLLRAAYKVVNLQVRLHMDASPVPATHLDRVSPSQNHDALTVLHAELVRIKRHLSIDAMPEPRPEPDSEPPGDRRWADVFALVQLLVGNIDRLSAAAAD
ncbi:MAG: hypothetical protein OXI15_04845 [Chromatiales bacterium]|nr:hypothetical protein [Chromatiales bacterium]